ncbi:unnamed protein product [Caenorhabditis brenneri]
MNTNELTLLDLLTLVRHWKETEKQIGSLLFMMFRTKQLCMDRFMDVVKQFDGAHFIEENVVVIPRSIDSKIELSWSHEQRHAIWDNDWKLEMKVKAIDQ